MRMRTNQVSVVAATICLIAIDASFSRGQEPATVDRQIQFALDIQPIFETHCFACHGPDRQESNFRLDVKSSALGIADFGDPPIVPGNADESPLLQFVGGNGDLAMPPEGEGRAP